jgi:adenylate cyclase
MAPEVAGTDDAAALENELLGGEPHLTMEQAAAGAGASVDQARLLWRALGFADVEAQTRSFTEADREALTRLRRLVTDAGADDEFGVGLIRALGHHMSRLVTWQVIALMDQVTESAGSGSEADARPAVAFLKEHLDDLDHLVRYAWRRHMAAVTGWRLARLDEDARRFSLTVGFADMVAYTRLSQQLQPSDLARLVARFESVSADVVSRNGGRVVKTVGDEVLFVADAAAQGAEIAMELAESMTADLVLPEVRVGLATGEVVSRLGDVFGPTVNVASRLTALASPGTVLVDATTAAMLNSSASFAVLPQQTRALRGLGEVTPSRLQRAAPTPSGQPERTPDVQS